MHRIEAYVTLAIIFIIGLLILFSPILFILKKKGKNITRYFSYFALFCSLFLIIFATILYMPITFRPEQYALNLNPFNWLYETNDINQIVVEFIPNIIMFIPLGMFIPVVFKNKRSFGKTILTVFMITFSIEFFQYFIGRSSDINDIISNLVGGIIGYGIFVFANKLLKNTNWWKRFIDN